MRPIDYKQTDPRWGKNDYSAAGEKTTIAAAGCGPTCMAMVIATLANIAITPADTAKWSKEHGFKACKQGTFYTYFLPQGKVFGIELERVNLANLKAVSNRKQYHDIALEAIKNGDMVICCMGPGHWTKGGHYILWYGLNSTNALISDPASSEVSRLNAPLSLLQSEVKYYWIVRVPNQPKRDSEWVDVVAGAVCTSGYIQDGMSFAPIRDVAQAFGAKVDWDPKTALVKVNGASIASVNRDGQTYAKSRVLADILHVKIEWDEVKRLVTFKKG